MFLALVKPFEHRIERLPAGIKRLRIFDWVNVANFYEIWPCINQKICLINPLRQKSRALLPISKLIADVFRLVERNLKIKIAQTHAP